MALWDLFLDNKGRKIHKWTHYFPIYEVFFQAYVNKNILAHMPELLVLILIQIARRLKRIK